MFNLDYDKKVTKAEVHDLNQITKKCVYTRFKEISVKEIIPVVIIPMMKAKAISVFILPLIRFLIQCEAESTKIKNQLSPLDPKQFLIYQSLL